MENMHREEKDVVETKYGFFKIEEYAESPLKPFSGGLVQVGATLKVKFIPKPELDVAKQPIGLIQTTRMERTEVTLAEQYEDEPLKLKRMTKNGTHIDQSTYVDAKGHVVSEDDAKKMFQKREEMPIAQTNPVYNATNILGEGGSAKTLLQQTGTNAFGSIYLPEAQAARLVDSPSRLLLPEETITHSFEIVALTLTEPYKFLGSMSWGYTAVAGKKVTITLLKLTRCGDEEPTEEFKVAAQLWNAQKIVDYSRNEEISRVSIPNV